MISTVLVPIDGSPLAEFAIPYAESLLPPASRGVLLGVVPRFDPLVNDFLRLMNALPDPRSDLESAQKSLEQVKVRIADANITWSIEAVPGHPEEEILRAIDRDEIQIVIMATHGRGAFERVTIGNVADRVVRASTVPVLLVREQDEAPRPGPVVVRMVVLLDGSPLAENAIPVAIELANSCQATVLLLQAINITSTLAGLSGLEAPVAVLADDAWEHVTEYARQSARDYLRETAVRFSSGGRPIAWEIVEGSPYSAIAEATATGDMIVMTSHGRSGLLRWVMGSVAEKLVREAPVPVLLVPVNGRGINGHHAQP